MLYPNAAHQTEARPDGIATRSCLLKYHIICFSMLSCFSASPTSAGGLHLDEWGAVTNNTMMSAKLAPADTSITTNTPFTLLICLTNMSDDRTLTWYQPLAPSADRPYVFLIISPSGKDVSPRTPHSPISGSGRIVSVGPHQMNETDFKLSEICKFGEPGTYKIIVKQDIGELKHPCWVISNPLDVSVVAGEGKRDNTNTPPDGF
jgi:hypothetical protein